MLSQASLVIQNYEGATEGEAVYAAYHPSSIQVPHFSLVQSASTVQAAIVEQSVSCGIAGKRFALTVSAEQWKLIASS